MLTLKTLVCSFVDDLHMVDFLLYFHFIHFYLFILKMFYHKEPLNRRYNVFSLIGKEKIRYIK